MKRLTNHIIAMFVTLLIFAPVFATESVGKMMKESGPWASAALFSTPGGPSLAGSFFLTGVVLTFVAFTIFAPVASISNYLIENRYMVPVLAEPLVTLGVMAVYVSVAALVMKWMTGGIWWHLYVSSMITFALPTLLYWLMLRLTSNWEYER